MTEEAKDKWLPCLVPEMISSEDSDEEESDKEDDSAQFAERPLLWRSDKVTNLFNKLDHKVRKNSTTTSKKMTFTRKQGLPSDRPMPRGPDWLFT